MTDIFTDRIATLSANDPVSHLPQRDGGWQRTFARFEPNTSGLPWAVLAYEPDNDSGPGSAWQAHLVEVFAAGDGGSTAVPHAAGELVVTTIIDDRNLPGLRQLATQPFDVTLLRYRPHRRCTMHVTDDHGTWIVKVLGDDRGEVFHRDADELWQASRRGELAFAVAKPHRWDASTHSVWQGLVPGVPLSPVLLGVDGVSCANQIGEALGTLAQSNVRPSATCTSADQMERTRGAVDQAIRRLPELGDDLGQILQELASRHQALPPDHLVPVHGAPHMHQWLIDDDQHLGLIDFDRFALGEVELDIATLIAELHYEGALTAPVLSMQDAVISGFESTAFTIDRQRLNLYLVHKRLTKVTRTAWALRIDGAARARRHLDAIIDEFGQ
jgi:hypothetical protein